MTESKKSKFQKVWRVKDTDIYGPDVMDAADSQAFELVPEGLVGEKDALIDKCAQVLAQGLARLRKNSLYEEDFVRLLKRIAEAGE